jgi:hypothetical protein
MGFIMKKTLCTLIAFTMCAGSGRAALVYKADFSTYSAGQTVTANASGDDDTFSGIVNAGGTQKAYDGSSVGMTKGLSMRIGGVSGQNVTISQKALGEMPLMITSFDFYSPDISMKFSAYRTNSAGNPLALFTATDTGTSLDGKLIRATMVVNRSGSSITLPGSLGAVATDKYAVYYQYGGTYTLIGSIAAATANPIGFQVVNAFDVNSYVLYDNIGVWSSATDTVNGTSVLQLSAGETVIPGPPENPFFVYSAETNSISPGVDQPLNLVVSNTGTFASNVVVSLSIVDSAFSIVSTNSSLSEIAVGATVTNFYTVRARSNAVAQVYADAFSLNVAGTGEIGPTNQTFSIAVKVPVTAFSSLDKMSFAAALTGSDTAMLTISNTAAFALSYSLSGNSLSGGSWLSPTNGTFTLAAGSATNITVTADGAQTPDQGRYTGRLSVTYNNNGSIPNPVTFPLVFNVGSEVSLLTNSVTVVSTNGIISDRYEPGEILDITVFSTNSGATAVSNVINSLSADPAYFIISNLTSAVYSYMPVGSITSTVYRVTISPLATNGTRLLFNVTNQAGSSAWPWSFELLPPIFVQGIPSVSPASISISVLPGAAATNTQVTVTNSGSAALTFSMTDTSTWEYGYDAMTGTRGVSGFIPAYNSIELNDPDTNSVGITAEYDGVSDSRSIGFSFPLYSVNYSNFYVTADGCVGLSNTTNVPLRSADRIAALPVSGGALLAPFWGKLLSPTGSIHYVRNADYLVISYTGVKQVQSGGGTNLEFQAALYTDGRIEFRYKTINGTQLSQMTAGIQNGSGSYTNLAVTPSNGVSVMLTPKRDQWVHYASAGGVTVGSRSSQTVKFVADATGKQAGTSTNLTVWFQWSTGGSNAVTVSVNVSTAAPVYSAVSALSFTGNAGQVTSVPFTITNAGNAQLTFAISNSAASAAGYISTNAVYSWIDISGIGTTVSLNDPSPNLYITAEDEGFSSMIPLGFSFPFYGSTCTQLCVSVNGALRLDTTGRVYALWNLASTNSGMPEKMIAPFWSDLAMDADATLKYHANSERVVITWENIRQNRFSGGSNLAFQVVLRPNGEMVFQYKRLEGAQWMNAVIGLRDNSLRIKQVSLLQTNDWVMTNYPSGTAYTQYVYSVSNRAVQFETAQIPVISYTPSAGSIPAGSNAVIRITGDASALLPGSPDYTLVTNAVLGVSHNAAGSPATLSITFTATNSQQSAFVRAAAVENLTDDQKTFGTPVFAPAVSRSTEGMLLSWTPPEDGLPRTYKVYFTTDLMIPFEQWGELATVTDATSYLDTDVAHQNAPVIYYRIGVLIE